MRPVQGVQPHSHIIVRFVQIRQMMCIMANGHLLAGGLEWYQADVSTTASMVGKSDMQTAWFNVLCSPGTSM